MELPSSSLDRATQVMAKALAEPWQPHPRCRPPAWRRAAERGEGPARLL